MDPIEAVSWQGDKNGQPFFTWPDRRRHPQYWAVAIHCFLLKRDWEERQR